MKSKSLLSAALIIGCWCGSAIGQVLDDSSLACQIAIAKAGSKFSDKVADIIEKCLVAAAACNSTSESNPAGCYQKLVMAGGKCTKGKMAPVNPYWDPGSSAGTSPTDPSLIGKALNLYKKQLANCAPGLGVNYAALGIVENNTSDANTTFDNFDEVVDALNSSPNGVSCGAHKRVVSLFPNALHLLTELYNSDNGAGNLPYVLAVVADPMETCR